MGNKLFKPILKLIQENPDLPVIPMVDSNVVDSDFDAFYEGAWGNCEIVEYYCTSYNHYPLFKGWDDESDIMCELEHDNKEKYKDWESWSDEKIQKTIDELPWIKCIRVNIVPETSVEN